MTAIHNILWGKAVDHVAGVKYNQEQDHTEEEQSLWTGSFRPDLVQLHTHTHQQMNTVSKEEIIVICHTKL